MLLDARILSYDETEHDRLLSETVQTAISAFGRSYKPNLLKMDGMFVKHTPQGYSLIKISSWPDGCRRDLVEVTNDDVSEFVRQVFLTFGASCVEMSEIAQSSAVLYALEKKFRVPVSIIQRPPETDGSARWQVSFIQEDGSRAHPEINL